MNTRHAYHDKYYNSDIFNTLPTEPRVNSSQKAFKFRKIRENHPNFEKTQDDIFHTITSNFDFPLSTKNKTRFNAYEKLYGSDIFNSKKQLINKNTYKKKPNATYSSSCMEPMKNNEQYKQDLKNYTETHRAEKKEYNPNKYIVAETAEERYYKEIYDPHGDIILPERKNLNDEIPQTKKSYALRKKHLKKEIRELNDKAAEKTKKQLQNYDLNKIPYAKKDKVNWNEKNNYHYIDPKYQKINPANSCKINKQFQLQSNLFKNDTNLQPINENAELINKRIEKEKRINYENQRPTVRKTRDLKNNDRSLWGSVHSKWEQTNLDWRNPQTEIMFGRTFNNDINKTYGPNGPTAFQRKINQLADTKNYDTITESEKVPIKDLEKPPSSAEVNGAGFERIDNVIKGIPNLNENQKLAIKMKATTMGLDDDDWDDKARTLTKFFSNPLLIKKNKNEELTMKINQMSKKEILKVGKENQKNLNECINNGYVITYPTKGGEFEKFDEGDIKKMFGKKGVHIYDVQKNQFDDGKFNTIKFKIRQNEGEKNIDEKLKEVKEDLSKQNYRIAIQKEKKRDIRKNQKRFVVNPGGKIGIMADLENNSTRVIYKKITPNKPRHEFSNQWSLVNYGYKNDSK